MNEFFTTLQKEARQIKLSHSEKQAMRMHVYTAIEHSPALSAAQTGAIEDFKNRKPVPSMYYWFSPRFAVPIAIVLLVGLSSGTAFAAQSALPGEPLYAIKINVNEKVATALATTPAAKASVNATIATTRLEEAESLASTGKLDATTTAELASNFAAHADAAQANTVAVAAVDPGSAAQLGTTFSSTLAAHSAILSQLATDSNAPSVKENSDTLAVQVLAQAVQGHHDGAAQVSEQSAGQTDGAVAVATPEATTQPETSSTGDAGESDAPATANIVTLSAIAPQTVSVTVDAASSTVDVSVRSEDAPEGRATMLSNTTSEAPRAAAKNTKAVSVLAHTSAGDAVIALALQTQASSTLAQAQSDFAALAPALDASTTLQIQAQLTAAQNLMGEGSALLGTSDNALAKEAFGRVLRMSVKLDAFLKAGKKFNVSFLSSLLK